MNIFSLIGTGAAWLNYNNAKKEYEALKEKANTILAAVRTYNTHKLDVVPIENEEKENKFPSGVFVSTILRVSYMVGKTCWVRPSLIITNTSGKTIVLTYFHLWCRLLGLPVKRYEKDTTKWTNMSQEEFDRTYGLPDGESLEYELKPNETKEFALETGRGILANMDQIRSIICERAGKKLITSCPKINIEGIEDADIRIEYKTYGSDEKYEGWVYNQAGVLRYCGEVMI